MQDFYLKKGETRELLTKDTIILGPGNLWGDEEGVFIMQIASAFYGGLWKGPM